MGCGITAWIAIQAFVNIAVNTATIPVGGLTLPFISYGGSSLLATMAAVGVLLSISRYGARAPAGQSTEQVGAAALNGAIYATVGLRWRNGWPRLSHPGRSRRVKPTQRAGQQTSGSSYSSRSTGYNVNTISTDRVDGLSRRVTRAKRTIARRTGASKRKTAAAPQSSVSRAAAESSDEILYIGVAGAVEEELARRAGIPFQAIESGQVRGMAPGLRLATCSKPPKALARRASLMAEFRPDVVFVTGGYVAGPVVLAASRAGLPVFIYLPDVEPGLAIQRMSRFARKVGVTFPEVARYFPGKAVVTGYPVRPEILALAGQKAVARQRLGLGQEEPVLLVFGGSRGARSINQALAAALPALLPRCQVVHITGTLDWPDVEAFMQSLPQPLRVRYHAYPYLHDEMPLALAAADLVVARAGASTLGEFPALALPSILVPYPYSGQHQDNNAVYLADRGAAIKLADAELAPGWRRPFLGFWMTHRLWTPWQERPGPWPSPTLRPQSLENSSDWHSNG